MCVGHPFITTPLDRLVWITLSVQASKWQNLHTFGTRSGFAAYIKDIALNSPDIIFLPRSPKETFKKNFFVSPPVSPSRQAVRVQKLAPWAVIPVIAVLSGSSKVKVRYMTLCMVYESDCTY